MKTLLALVAIANTLQCCHLARILAVFPDPARSHMMTYEPLTKALAARGHQVTVISAYPQKTPIANYTDINVPFAWFGVDPNMKDMTDLHNRKFKYEEALVSGHVPYTTCMHYLKNQNVQKLIKSTKLKFDLIIMEMLVYECFLGFSYINDAPIIGIFANYAPHWIMDSVGNPSPYAYIPNTALFSSDRMTFHERVMNTISILVRKWGDDLFVGTFSHFMIEKYFHTRHAPPLNRLKERIAFLFVNSDVSFHIPRPQLPNVIDVAGMHIKPPKKLPKDIQEFMDGATNGVICFSMGSHSGTLKFPLKMIRQLLEIFSKMEFRVLWKEDVNIQQLPKNVMIKRWIPQADVLAHRNVRVFICHGGLLGLQEAIYHKIPIVGIPICKDQEANIDRAKQLGFAVKLDFDNITSESIQWAIGNVITNSSYHDSVRRVSARFRDHPQSSVERAVFWTEYVLRHKGARHLRSGALDLSWYQYFLLDVMAVLALSTALILHFSYRKFTS